MLQDLIFAITLAYLAVFIIRRIFGQPFDQRESDLTTKESAIAEIEKTELVVEKNDDPFISRIVIFYGMPFLVDFNLILFFKELKGIKRKHVHTSWRQS